MYIFKNAIRCIGRSKGRNILIGIIALVIAVSACIGLSIRQAADNAKNSALNEMSVTASISYDRGSAMEQIGGGRPSGGERPSGGMGRFDRDQFASMMGNASSLTLDEYKKYAEAESVQDFYYTLTAYFNGTDEFLPVSDETEEEDLEDLEYWSEQGDETQMYLLGKKYLDEYDDPEEAEHWLKKASENGNEYAMYLLYKCYRDGRIEDEENEKMKYLKMALNKGYDAAEYEYGKLLREKEPEEAMKYLGKAADQRNPYAAYAYAKMCSERGDIAKAKEYFRIAVMYKPELGFRVGLWYYYEQNERENGKAYLQFAAERGDTAAEEALKAINNGVNARLLSGVLNLFRHASRVIDDRAKAYAKSGMMQGVDKKLREQIRQKKEGLGVRMG